MANTINLHSCITGSQTAEELAANCKIDTLKKIPDTARRRRYFDRDLFNQLPAGLKPPILRTCNGLAEIDRAVHDDTRKNSLSGEEIHSYAYGEIDTKVFRFPYHLCTGLVVMLKNSPPPMPVAPPPAPPQPEIIREVILKPDEPVASSMPYFYASMEAERGRRNLFLGAVALVGAAAFTLFAVYLRRYPRFRLMVDLGDSFRRIFRMRAGDATTIAQQFGLRRGFRETRLTLQPGQVVPFRAWLAARRGTPRQLARVDRVIADHGLAPVLRPKSPAAVAPHPTPPPTPPPAVTARPPTPPPPAPGGGTVVVADSDVVIIGNAAPPTPSPRRPVIRRPATPPEPPQDRLTQVLGGRPDGRVPVELHEGPARPPRTTPHPDDANLPVAVATPPPEPTILQKLPDEVHQAIQRVVEGTRNRRAPVAEAAEPTVVSGRNPFVLVADQWDPENPVVLDYLTDRRDIEAIAQLLGAQIKGVAGRLAGGEAIDPETLGATKEAYRTLREIADNLGSGSDIATLIDALAEARALILGVAT